MASLVALKSKLKIPKLPFILAAVMSIPLFSMLYFFTKFKNESIRFSQAEAQGIIDLRKVYSETLQTWTQNQNTLNATQVQQFESQVSQISDDSNLILDPELEAIYLIIAFSTDLPGLISELSTGGNSISIQDRISELQMKIQKASTYIKNGRFKNNSSALEELANIEKLYSQISQDSNKIQKTQNAFDIAMASLNLSEHVILDRIQNESSSRNFALGFSISLWVIGLILALLISVLEIKLVRQKEVVEEVAIRNSKLAELGTLSAQIAHEINNPLSVIKGKASLLKKLLNSNPLSVEQIQKGLDQIEKTSDRISKIVKGLKTTTRNTESDPFIKVTLKSIFEDIEILYFEKVNKANVILELPPEQDLGKYLIDCRPAEVSQVFLNLISNAVDAIQNSEKPWIKIELSEQSNHLRLRFIDSGKGIPPEVAQKLMQPFFTTKSVGQGTGLGLSISKKIIETHGGAITLNQDHANTCFEIQIPYSKQELTAAA